MVSRGIKSIANGYIEQGMGDPSPLDPRLHGPHNHALGAFPTLAECTRQVKQEVKTMNTSKGFRKDAKYTCRRGGL